MSAELWTDKYGEMSNTEKKTLQRVMASCGAHPFEWSRLYRLNERFMSGAELKVGLIGLIRCGVVNVLKRSLGERAYVMDVTAFLALQHCVWPELCPAEAGDTRQDRGTVAAWIHDEVEFVGDDRYGIGGEFRGMEEIVGIGIMYEQEQAVVRKRGLAYDLFFVLDMLSRESFRLTQQGMLHKRILQQLADAIAVESDDVRGMAMRIGITGSYPPQVSYVLDAAIRLKLVQMNDRLELQPAVVSKWLQMNVMTMHEVLYALTINVHWPECVWLQHAAAALHYRRGGGLFPLRSLIEPVVRLFAPDAQLRYEEAENRLVRSWLMPLCAFGWFELLRDSSTGAVLGRWTVPVNEEIGERRMMAESWGQSKEALIVQPNFDVLVSPVAPFRVRWTLGGVAEHRHTDGFTFSTYRLSRDSISNAAGRGLAVDRVVHFLRQYAAYGVPDNVEETLKQWGGANGSKSDWISPDESERCEISGSAAQTTDAARIEGPDRDSGDYAYNVRELDRDPIDGTYPERIDTSEAFIVRSPYEIEPNALIPSLEHVYPGLGSITPMWLRESRRYHLSTQRNLIETAIACSGYVKLGVNGRDKLLLPKSIAVRAGDWHVLGFVESSAVTLNPSHWQEIQLILPGINDT